MFAAVNHLQATELVVSAEMVELQRIAWDNGISVVPAAETIEPHPGLGRTQLMPNYATATGWPLWLTAIAR